MGSVIRVVFLLACLASTVISYPTGSSSSGDQPTEMLAPVDENSSCNAPEDGSAYEDAVNSLNKGLILLKSYSHTVNYHTFENLKTVRCPFNSLSQAYQLDRGNSRFRTFVTVLDAYAQLASDGVSDLGEGEPKVLMQGVYDVISAVLIDYRRVLAPEHCNCSSSEDCFTAEYVLYPPLAFNPHYCKPYSYVADYLYDEVNSFINYLYGEGGRLRMIWSRNEQKDMNITLPTDDEWIRAHLDASSPASGHLQQNY